MIRDPSGQSGARSTRRAQIEVILAAVAFAASVPANKLLLADVAPLALSGVLYMSAGSLCATLAWLSGRSGTAMARNNAVRGAEWVWLLRAVVSGGVLAPLLLFLGLRDVSGHVAGPLLNFEAVFTVGLSITLLVPGLRQLGVIQAGMLFALAPGFAAILSWGLLHEGVAARGLLALASMTAGALLLATDRHEHLHVHEALEHAHAHTHDEHHQHEHTPEQLAQVPHSHWHRHERAVHRHPHVHDIHHRH